jgi:hypothetical protein
MPLSKKSASCELSHVLSPPSTPHYCSSVVIATDLQIGRSKQEVFSHNNIRAVSRVVKQLPVEML